MSGSRTGSHIRSVATDQWVKIPFRFLAIQLGSLVNAVLAEPRLRS